MVFWDNIKQCSVYKNVSFFSATAIYELDKLNADIVNMKAPKISGKLYDILKDYGIAHLEEGHIRNITGRLFVAIQGVHK